MDPNSHPAKGAQPPTTPTLNPVGGSASLEELKKSHNLSDDAYNKLKNKLETLNDPAREEKILNVIRSITLTKDPDLINKAILRGGGIAFIEKLGEVTDSVERRNEILKRVVNGRVYFAELNKILTDSLKIPRGAERDAFLERAIHCLDKLGGAHKAQVAMKQGGTSGLFSAAGQLSGGGRGFGPGGGNAAGTVATGPSSTSTVLAVSPTQTIDPQTRISELFNKLPSQEKARHELIAAAVLEFASDIRREQEKEKKAEEEDCRAFRGFAAGSNETIEDLQTALETIITQYGTFNNALPNIRQFVQTCYKFNTAGDNITVGNVLEVLQGWLDLFNRSRPSSPKSKGPTNQPPPPNPDQLSQLRTQTLNAQHPAPSPVASGRPSTSSHPA
jgi:hypothetical protein